MAGSSPAGGMITGKSHTQGGEHFVVPETGQHIEAEGNEPLVSNEALRDPTKRAYTGTNKEILNKINKRVGAKGMNEKATEIHAGDAIVCKVAVDDKTKKTVKGTDKEVVSAINEEAGCKQIESGGEITKNGKTKKFKGGGTAAKKEEEKILKARWDKKKAALDHLSNNIRRLRVNVSKDLNSGDEKKELTALVVAMMDKTAERVGNETSKANGHLGITGLQKKNVIILGNSVHLNYTGKSGVKHDLSFSDKRIAKSLKKAIKNAPKQDIFTTSSGFKVKGDGVNRYLIKFGITAKDLRGYSANKWMIERLKKVTPEETEYKRKRQFNKVLKDVAEKVGHGAATLRKHYLLPALAEKFVLESKVIDLKNFYREGGEVKGRPFEYHPKKKEQSTIPHERKAANVNLDPDNPDITMARGEQIRIKGIPRTLPNEAKEGLKAIKNQNFDCTLYGTCVLAADDAAKLLNHHNITDYKVLEGQVEVNEKYVTSGNHIIVDHIWIELKNGQVIDLTVEQFDKYGGVRQYCSDRTTSIHSSLYPNTYTPEQYEEQMQQETEGIGLYVKELKESGLRKNLDHLYKEHHEAWDFVEEVCDNVCNDNCIEYARKLLKVWDEELLPHFKEEENDLFPMIEDYTNRSIIRQIKEEHIEFEAIIEKIRTYNREEDIKRFCKMLQTHIKLEEDLFGKYMADPYKNTMGIGGQSASVQEKLKKRDAIRNLEGDSLLAHMSSYVASLSTLNRRFKDVRKIYDRVEMVEMSALDIQGEERPMYKVYFNEIPVGYMYEPEYFDEVGRDHDWAFTTKPEYMGRKAKYFNTQEEIKDFVGSRFAKFVGIV